MHIEVISRTQDSQEGRPALLFIHGAFHGAWCWDEYLLPWFAERGWEAHALSLRGHGTSDGRQNIRRWTLDDYASDVEAVLKTIGRPAVLIGHSIGGVIAQRCWDRVPGIAGMVCYANSPLKPDSAVIMRLMRLRPFSLLAGQFLNIASLQLRATEPILFSPAFDSSKVEAWRKKLCLESPKALSELFTRAPQAKRPEDHRPVLVLAGSDDWSISMASHEALALAFRADMKVCPGAHDLMLDPQWEVNATAMHQWLQQKFDAQPA